MKIDTTFGLNPQAIAVMLELTHYNFEDFDSINTYPWYNGRERGVCFTFSKDCREELAIAVFEYRNTDSLCAIRWKRALSINPPTIQSDGDLAYPDSFSRPTYRVGCYEVVNMVAWIVKQIRFYLEECDENAERSV